MTLREFIEMQHNINEIYRMRQKAQEAYDRKRKELEGEIKQCDLNMLAMSKDKSEPDEVFRAVYLQRCELLRKYREKYGKKAEYQLRDQLDEARKAYVEKYVSEGFLKSQTVQQTGGMKIIYDSEGKAHYFPKHAHNCRVFKIIRNQNKAEE